MTKYRRCEVPFCILLAALIFALDLSIPLGVAAGVPYIAVILLTFWATGRITLAMAIVTSVLTVAGFFFSASDGELWKALDNRFLALFAIWSTTLVILQRKRAEKMLAEKTMYLDNILRSSTEYAISTTDLDFRITYFNPMAEKLHGYKSEDVIGKTVMEMHTKEKVSPERFTTAIENIHRFGEHRYTMEKETEEGTRYIEARVSGIYDSDRKLVGYSNFARDVTEIRETEAKLSKSSKLAAIGELAAGVAHEINNPLTNIYNYTQLLGKKFEKDEYVQERIEKITNNILRARDITRGLLTLAREPEGDRQTADISRLCLEIRAEIQVNLDNRDDLILKGDSQKKLPNCRINEGQIRQVINNLIENAIDAMPDGGTLTIESDYDAEGNFVRITVGDTGVGIPEKDLPLIFNPFFTTKGVGSGTGLGLSISAGLMRQHQGDLTVESEEGVGTTFTLSIPVVDDDQS